MTLINELNSICKTDKNVNLKKLCSMHIGGIGKYVCYPQTKSELILLIKYLKHNNINYYVFGNGTNIIFEDREYSTVLICLKKLNNIMVIKNNCYIDAGVGLFELNKKLATIGLGGMEWSYGIPGTIGGAIKMNAGAFGHEICEFVKWVSVLRNGQIKKIKSKDMKFCYRQCKNLGADDIILRVALSLNPTNPNEIIAKQKDILTKRILSQPYGTFNAGSIFKKTEFGSAGKTIDKLGLKGVKIGDIQISNKHANFFVNLGNGTSEDLHKLINFVKIEVKQKEGIQLQEEVMFVENKRE